MAKSLSERMADVARELQNQYDTRSTLDTAVRLAVNDVRGADAAGISLVARGRRVDTQAASSDMVVQADRLQLEAEEGPGLDAIWEQGVVHSGDLAADERWPVWGPRVAQETQARSLMAFRLFITDHTVGALSLYSRTTGAFDTDDRDDGLAIAAHISIAVANAQHVDNMDLALASRTLISQAVGIVMGQYDLDSERAFSVLSRLASTSNTKLRDVAYQICADRRMRRSEPSDQTQAGR